MPYILKLKNYSQEVVEVYTFNLSTHEADAEGSLNLKPICSTECPGQLGLQ